MRTAAVIAGWVLLMAIGGTLVAEGGTPKLLGQGLLGFAYSLVAASLLGLGAALTLTRFRTPGDPSQVADVDVMAAWRYEVALVWSWRRRRELWLYLVAAALVGAACSLINLELVFGVIVLAPALPMILAGRRLHHRLLADRSLWERMAR